MRAEHHISLARAKRKKMGKKALRVGGALIGASLCLLVGFAFLLRADFLQITSVSVSGNRFLDTAVIESLARAELGAEYASVFPKGNIFLYPRESVRERILNISKRVASAEVRTKGLSSVVISVLEHDPAFLWCGEEAPAGARPLETPCFFMNQEGFMFAEAPRLSPGIYFEIYGAPEGVAGDVPADGANMIGSYFFSSPARLQNVLAIKDALGGLGFDPVGAYLAEEYRYEMIVHGKDASGIPARIIWDPAGDISNIIANLESALEIKYKESPAGDALAGLSYIDTRFDNKVVFKFAR